MTAGVVDPRTTTGRRQRPWVLQLAALLMVLGAVDWRRGAYISGLVDLGVLSKSLVDGLALLLAVGWSLED